jgi:hypothetical protein
MIQIASQVVAVGSIHVSQAESQHLNVRFEPDPFSPYLEPPGEGDAADRDP